MMILLAIAMFSAAFAISAYAIVATVAPNIDRIAAALAGRPQQAFPAAGARTERRVPAGSWTVRRRAASPAPAPAPATRRARV